MIKKMIPASIKRKLRHWQYYASKRVAWEEQEFIAIVSTGRTGTQFFAGFFNQNTENIYALHEPFGKVVYDLAEQFQKGTQSAPKIKQALLQEHYVIQHKMSTLPQTKFLESDSNLAFLIPIIKTTFPKYKIIHIIRDGKDFVRSFCSRTRMIDGRMQPTYAFDKNWRLLPGDVGDDQMAKRWPKMSLIQKGAWAWAFRNAYILEQIREDEHAISVRFEDIFGKEQAHRGLKEVIRFTDARLKEELAEKPLSTFFQRKVNATDQFLVGSYEDWSATDQSAYAEITAKVATLFGY